MAIDYEAMILNRTPDEKRNIIKVWEAHKESLPDFGQEIIQERIDWLKATIPMEKKKKAKKSKKAKKTKKVKK